MSPNRPAHGALFKILTLTLPALVVSGVVFAAVAEVWVRLSWEPKHGSPGLFLHDPVTRQRLAANYDGWFAGVPVRTNNLGMRAARDYDLAKGPNTFRILVLGDSVTFGHGSVHTYPDLLEQMLREWRPEVDWQVWNAGVPGYNTSQELAGLIEVGATYQPDLVVVGFYENDLIDNRPGAPPGAATIALSRILSFVQRHLYSYELYKKVALNFAWRLSGSVQYRMRLEHIATEAELLVTVDQIKDLEAQKLTSYARLSDEQARGRQCIDHEVPTPSTLDEMQREPSWNDWLDAVRGFQNLHRRGEYRVVFFVNVVPPICPDGDFFYEGGTALINDFLMKIMGDGTPAVSTFDTFLHRRPSEMPAARAHAIGNANQTKAEVLFEYLRDRILPPLMPAGRVSSGQSSESPPR